jgi:aspartokinase-like uncharacterized kinase
LSRSEPSFLVDRLGYWILRVDNALGIRGRSPVVCGWSNPATTDKVFFVPKHVMKLGGSLFLFPNFAEQLRHWWRHLQVREHELEPTPWFVVVGGGKVVDAVRQWDETHELPARDSHQLALAGMSVTAQFVARLMDWPLAVLSPNFTSEQCETGWSPSSGGVGAAHAKFRPGIRQHQAFPDCPLVIDLSVAVAADPELPASWEVTSDSLALWFAHRIGSRRLVLMKAVNPLETPVKIGKIAQDGWVDAYFSRMWSKAPEVEVQIAHFSHCPQTSQITGAS